MSKTKSATYHQCDWQSLVKRCAHEALWRYAEASTPDQPRGYACTTHLGVLIPYDRKVLVEALPQ